MKASQKRFFARILTVCMGLVSFLLVDAALNGVLGFAGALCLIPASLFLTNVLWQLSLRKIKRQRPMNAACLDTQSTTPTLYVISGGVSNKNSNEPPHVA